MPERHDVLEADAERADWGWGRERPDRLALHAPVTATERRQERRWWRRWTLCELNGAEHRAAGDEIDRTLLRSGWLSPQREQIHPTPSASVLIRRLPLQTSLATYLCSIVSLSLSSQHATPLAVIKSTDVNPLRTGSGVFRTWQRGGHGERASL